MNYSRRRLLRCAAIIAVTTMPIDARAASDDHEFNISSQALKYALRDLARQSGLELGATSAVLSGKQAPVLRGRYSTQQALDALLTGSGLVGDIREGTIFIRGRSTAATEPGDADGQTISVTGTRIAGTRPTSTTIIIGQQQIHDSGQNDLGEVIRSLPQNFSGGQNPGVVPGAIGIANQNINGGSGLNLRGLGPDATLTLLNGHRLSYGSFVQAIDISAIPVAAVDRIEIMTDGASAIYGSDAVGGVGNIILKRDFNGIDTRARIGGATDGGDFQQQFSATAGKAWESGNIMLAYDYGHSSAIRPSQRDYTHYQTEPNLLLPSQQHHSAIVSGHENVTETLTFTADGSFSWRSMPRVTTQSSRITTENKDTVFSISPALTFRPSPTLSLNLNGVYSQDRTRFSAISTSLSGAPISSTEDCYCNKLKVVESDATATLFALPGGPLRTAVGGGYRETSFQSSTNTASAITGSQKSEYAFGEFNAPFVSPSVGIKGVNELTVTAAIRYEHYERIGSIATPKVGALYSPIPGLTFKGNYGRSFKAPTLSQQFQRAYVYLYPARLGGATTSPATTTFLYSFGGNPNLKPERATNWSGTVSIAPISIPSLSLDVTYFSIRYRNRIIQPIANAAALFSDPIYAQFLKYSPSTSEQSAFISQSLSGLIYNSGSVYNPANVLATATNTYTNAARQAIEGVDILERYATRAFGGQLTITANGSYIRSRQQNAEAGQAFDLAGSAYNPPHFTGRFGSIWTASTVTLAAFVNYIGGVDDTRPASLAHGDPMVTADATVSYRFNGKGLMHGVEMQLAISNLTNASPPYLKNTQAYYPNYDPTNYSAIGRVVSFSIDKRW